MSTFMLDDQSVRIPEWVNDFPSFRRWFYSDNFPEEGRICFINGEVWVDMSREQFAHNQIKGEYTAVLGSMTRSEGSGRYFPDGFRLSNLDVFLSVNPDGMFVSMGSFQTGRVRLIEGAKEGYIEMEGTPDMVLEVLSPSSIIKDSEWLLELYWQAGIPEYWFVDPRGGKVEFIIYRRTNKGYVPARKQAGWQKSAAFGKSFRLTQGTDALGHPEYHLEVR